MISTDEGKDEMCTEENRATGGATYRSWVYGLHTAGVSTSSSATVSLSCTSRRLAENHIRRLQTGFVLVSSASFSDAVDATVFSDDVTQAALDIASEFESQVATTLGVAADATVLDVEVTVASDDAVSFGHQHGEINVLIWTLTFVAGGAVLSID